MELDHKKEKNKKANECCPVSETQDKYPWGLRIRLDTEQIDRLGGLPNIEPGDQTDIVCKARIISESSEEIIEKEKPTKRRNIEIQITSMAISVGAEYEKAFKEASKGG